MTKGNSRLFKPAYASELLGVATEDLKTAQVLIKSFDQVRIENIVFHLQQAIEKSLKAVICHLGKPIPSTHDIEAILVHLGEVVPPNSEALSELTPFATVRRYEEGNDIITEEDVLESEKICKDVLSWAHARLSDAQ